MILEVRAQTGIEFNESVADIVNGSVMNVAGLVPRTRQGVFDAVEAAHAQLAAMREKFETMTRGVPADRADDKARAMSALESFEQELETFHGRLHGDEPRLTDLAVVDGFATVLRRYGSVKSETEKLPGGWALALLALIPLTELFFPRSVDAPADSGAPGGPNDLAVFMMSGDDDGAGPSGRDLQSSPDDDDPADAMSTTDTIGADRLSIAGTIVGEDRDGDEGGDGDPAVAARWAAVVARADQGFVGEAAAMLRDAVSDLSVPQRARWIRLLETRWIGQIGDDNPGSVVQFLNQLQLDFFEQMVTNWLRAPTWELSQEGLRELRATIHLTESDGSVTYTRDFLSNVIKDRQFARDNRVAVAAAVYLLR